MYRIHHLQILRLYWALSSIGSVKFVFVAAFTQSLSAGYPVQHVTSRSDLSNIAALRNDILTEKSNSLQETASELLSLLLESQQANVPLERERVEKLMDSLAEAKVEFDPDVCLNGPLFCAIYQKGPVPFWEKYSVNFGQEKKNLKGQRFTKKAENDDKLDVLNYAQLVGNCKLFSSYFWIAIIPFVG